MSEHLRIVNKDVSMKELFDGRLERFGIVEERFDDSSPNRRVLTDGRNCLLVYGTENLFFETREQNNPSRIVAAIEEAFDARIFTEHEPEFLTTRQLEPAERP